MPEKPQKLQIGKLLSDYLHELDCIAESIGPAVTAIFDRVEGKNKELDVFIEEKCEVTEDAGKTTSYKFKVEHQKEHNELKRSLKRSRDALHLIPKSLIISMVASYDAFLGRLVRTLYESQPSILKGGERNISFSQLKEFSSIRDAEEFILEKEVESLLRKSHSDHFKQLEKDFGIKLKVEEPIWQRFIELTERRNLFVHCNGIISSQYLKVCKEHGVKFSNDFTLGDELTIDPKYFFITKCVLYEIGFKLTHTLWRKVLPKEIDQADEHLNDIGFELLCDKHYGLANKVYEYAIENLPRHSSEVYRLMFLVNLCISYNQSDKIDETKKLLAKEDWSAKSDDFKLANKVLNLNYDEAISIMEQIPEETISKRAYREWPLFEEFRKESSFQTCYQNKFGEPFEIQEQPDDFEEEATEDITN